MHAPTQLSSVSACRLCGSEPNGRSDRKRHLRQLLRELASGSVGIPELRARLDQMCELCQMLMIGIVSDADRIELEERIRKELQPIAAGAAEPTSVPGEAGAGPKRDREHIGSRRDPEERPVKHERDRREKMLDKTLADSFPTSDPPSSIPDPAADDAEDIAA
jgi:hypothetical protein